MALLFGKAAPVRAFELFQALRILYAQPGKFTEAKKINVMVLDSMKIGKNLGDRSQLLTSTTVVDSCHRLIQMR